MKTSEKPTTNFFKKIHAVSSIQAGSANVYNQIAGFTCNQKHSGIFPMTVHHVARSSDPIIVAFAPVADVCVLRRNSQKQILLKPNLKY